MMKPHGWLVLAIAGTLVGLTFAGLSTYDFVQHLDRQVHSIHCSFIPGLTHASTGESGCQVAMLSPYSSVFRASLWGGIPIALPAMAVFAFLLFFALDLLLARRQEDPRATGFFAVATGLPVAASAVMAYISLSRLGTTCKLCVGVYVASVLCLAGALGLWRRARSIAAGGEALAAGRARAAAAAAPNSGDSAARPAERRAATPAAESARWRVRPMSPLGLAAAFGVGVLFVAVPVALYAASAPDHSRFVGTCDALAHPDDPYGVMIPLGGGGTVGAAPAIEVLDPLCPACRGFEERLGASGLAPRLNRRAVLFPLDNTCNWMVTETLHPGACVVSEAVLCAGDRAGEVIAWAFANQEQVRTAASHDPGAAARMVRARFPQLGACVGSPTARTRLNQSLRWAVQNGIHVVTPQLYVNGVKLCDEDVDLGLEYSLGVMLDRYSRGQLAGNGAPAAPTTPPVATPRAPAPPSGAAAPTSTATAPRAPGSPAGAATPAATAGGAAEPSGAPSGTSPAAAHEGASPSGSAPSGSPPRESEATAPAAPREGAAPAPSAPSGARENGAPAGAREGAAAPANSETHPSEAPQPAGGTNPAGGEP